MKSLFIIILWTVLWNGTVHAGISDYDVMDFGALPNGITDNTAAFQAALDHAGEKGGIVHVPAGRFRIDGNLTIPESVTIEGIMRGPHLPIDEKVTMLLAYAGRDDEQAPPFITMRTNSTIKGLSIYYPDQKVRDILPYPWTVHIAGSRVNILDVTFANSYNGIDCGTLWTHSHHLRNIHMTALRRGVYIDRVTDIGRVENVHIHNVNWWNVRDPEPFKGDDSRILKEYTMKHLEGFIVGRVDWGYMVNCFVIWMKTGFRFIETPLREGERGKGTEQANLLITQSGSDMSPLSVIIERVQDHAGVCFENCQFMNGIDIQKTNTGPVKFTNCGFWGETNTGPLDGTIIRNRGTGQLMMTSCHFSTWEDPARKDIVWNPDAPLIDIDNGSLIMTGCVFKDYGVPFNTHILLRGNANATVINGNIVEGGPLKVDNQSAADVQIFGNVTTR